MARRSKKTRTIDSSRGPTRAAELEALPARFKNIDLPPWLVAIVFALLIGVVYLPSAKAPLIFDDLPAVTENDSIAKLWPLVGPNNSGPLNPPPELPVSGRPLVNLSFAVNHYLDGLNPKGYHLVNFAIHFLAALLLWAIVRRTLRLPYFAGQFDRVADWLALAAATLWALHPLLTESVVYITQRTELMMGLAYLATLYFSLRYWASRSSPPAEGAAAGNSMETSTATVSVARVRTLWLAFAVLACLAGMASKEVMVSAPLIVLLFERTFIAGSLASALRRSWPLYVGLVSTWVLLICLNLNAPHRDAAGFSFGVTGPAWWLTQSKVLFTYLRLVVWPAPLLIHYQLPYLTTLAQASRYVFPLTLIALASLYLLWKNRPLGFCAAWFFAILSPTFVIPIYTEVAAERRMYLALVIPVVIFVVGGYLVLLRLFSHLNEAGKSEVSVRRATKTIVAIALALTLVYMFVDSSRLVAYENELSLWLSVYNAQPDNLRAIEYIGTRLETAGEINAAIGQYQEAINRDPTGRDPVAIHSHYRMGVLLLKRGDAEQALPHLALAAALLQNSVGLHTNYGLALYAAGRTKEAIVEYRKSLELKPNDFASRLNLGMALQKDGKYQEAIEAFEHALRLKPDSIGIYGDLARCYLQLNDRPNALAKFQHGLELARAADDVALVKKFTAALEAKP